MHRSENQPNASTPRTTAPDATGSERTERVQIGRVPIEFTHNPSAGGSFRLNRMGHTDLSSDGLWCVWIYDPTEELPDPTEDEQVFSFPDLDNTMPGFEMSPENTTFNFSWSLTDDMLTMEWTDVRHPCLREGRALHVVLTAKVVPGKEEVELNIDVDIVPHGDPAPPGPAPGIQALGKVDFVIKIVSPPAPKLDLFLPLGDGVVLSDVMNQPTGSVVEQMGEKFWPNPGVFGMQYLALYQSEAPDSGMTFLATRDTQGYNKRFQFTVTPGSQEDAGDITFVMRHFPENNLQTQSHRSPYPLVWATLSGDWYNAALYYREGWAKHQAWLQEGDMQTNPHYSKTVKDMHLLGSVGPQATYMKNPDGRSCKTGEDPALIIDPRATWPLWQELESFLQDQADFLGTNKIATVHYGWYPPKRHDAEWGLWLPPVPDWVQPIKDAAAAGFPAAPYVITHEISEGFEPPIPGYEREDIKKKYAVLDFEGKPREGEDLLCNPTYILCQATPYARDYAIWLGELLAKYHAEGIYLDTLTAFAPQLCFAEDHGHPPGGGSYTTQARQQNMSLARAKMRETFPNAYAISEQLNEFFLNRMEIAFGQYAINVLGNSAAMVPAFQTVYGRYIRTQRTLGINYPPADNPNLFTEAATSFGRQLISAESFLGHDLFAGGRLSPTRLADLIASTSSGYDHYANLLKNYLALLSNPTVRQHVTFGERLRDPVTSSPTFDFKSLGLPDYEGLGTFPYGFVQPLVYTSAWGAPQAGSIVFVFANWTREGDQAGPLKVQGAGNQTISVKFSLPEHGYDAAQYTLSEITPSGVLSGETLSHAGEILSHAGETLSHAGETLSHEGCITIDSLDIPELSMRVLMLTPETA